ncbi:GntR family transcriptional regulator [Marinitenerispora sediminis]|uniref:GntR family transcriptional regulator n=1 Tax=Marinitenerispora sediminis TaxID=1931232 RepID=A0A368T1N5_9ACTN|nr:GntR family transcriptional regulator [Marinitenerispora sediminis]RCV48426.1 GntR family transcriptional regulator [Marinitenerispora sediminis]RCV49236.1 GntR family transcriptional regulator [Marinitenerispora sediminis]RCV54353.1 GntR family transcriptional regulator [Marinitenerispora sediminis]
MPLYFQVATQLEAAIDSGALPPGSRLDNEVQLAGRLGLSRPTVRQAIQTLVDKGLVVRKRGVGSQVVHNRVKRSLELSSLYDDLSRIGQQPTTRVLTNTVEPASPPVARALDVPEKTPVWHLERVRYARSEPIARMRNHLPADLIAQPGDELLAERGLYQLLRAGGMRLHAARQTIGARAANRAEAELLEEPEGAPLLTMERTAYDAEGRAVEYGSHLYRASRYSFDLSLRGPA